MTHDRPRASNIHVLVIGTGPVGLINARTLLDDGFKVTVISKDETVGGEWAVTYPDLTTNSPWGAFTFSGLEMALPSSSDGSVVPAYMYRRYLEDFYHYFVEGRAEVRLNTEIINLEPKEKGRGWVATCRTSDGEHRAEFDRVVVASGELGKPIIPQLLSSSPIPVYHSSDFAAKSDKLLSDVPNKLDNELPDVNGDDKTIVVIGGGKSSMDIASILANRGKKVVWSYRGKLNWYFPCIPPGGSGANRVDILFGPGRYMDSWAMWFYHCTFLGARWFNSFWTFMRNVISPVYCDQLPVPSSDPHLTLCHFGGGISLGPNDFMSLVRQNKIAVLHGEPISVGSDRVTYELYSKKQHQVKCKAIVAATGYDFNPYPFLRPGLKSSLGLDKVPPSDGWEERVKRIRRKWKTIHDPEKEVPIHQAKLYRGLVPIGRYNERDLVFAAGAKASFIPALCFEVESHWISSFLQDDPFLKVPSEKDMLQDVEEANEFNLARYPGTKPKPYPASTYFVGFNDVSYTRLLLRDMSVDPWRQKSTSIWKFWDWLDVRFHPDQYATIGKERRTLREKSG